MNEPGPGLEEKVQLQTVNHKLRTSLVFGLLVALVFGGGLYLCLR